MKEAEAETWKDKALQELDRKFKVRGRVRSGLVPWFRSSIRVDTWTGTYGRK